MRTTLLACALALSVLPGCFLSRQTTNDPLSAPLATLQPGTTTAAEVVERLGAPNDVVQLGRRSAYRYDFTNRKVAGFSLIVVSFINADQRQDRAWLFFDEADVLTHAGSTLTAENAQYAMPWVGLDYPEERKGE